MMVLKVPITDSTTICPLLGTSLGLPTVNLIRSIRNRETIQLVIIELVIGRPKNSKPMSICSAYLDTSDAAIAENGEVKNKTTNV